LWPVSEAFLPPRDHVSALRDHLVDMNALTLDAMVTEEPRDDGLSMIVTGKGRTLQAILHMVPAHAAELDKMPAWSASAAINQDGAVLTVTSPDETVQTRIKGLGFFGLMATGNHHLAIAQGMSVHEHH
jgi:hypothetical protein